MEDITNMIREREPLHLYEYEDITDDLYMLSKTGYVLESKSVLKILDVLKIIKSL